MTKTALLDIFSELSRSQVPEGVLAVEPHPSNSQVFLGINSFGDAMLLFEDQGSASPSRQFESLEIDYGRTYKIASKLGTATDTFSSIRLKSSYRRRLEVFCQLADVLVSFPHDDRSADQTRDRIQDFISLFNARPVVAREKVVGLYGELLLISYQSDTEAWIEAWHSELESNKDFSFPGYFVEVKTTEARTRVHQMGLDQLSSPSKRVILASIAITQDPSGVTLVDLLDSILSRITRQDLYSKAVNLFFSTIGSNTEDLDSYSFTTSEQRDSVLLFDCDALPRPSVAADTNSSAVKMVKFSLDISLLISIGLPSIDESSISVSS
jgi:hypothetical protein